jgi:hypothetical protein
MFSYTSTAAFTRTHAKYLASKVAADLRQMQCFYGSPSDQEIDNYLAELTEYLARGLLLSVEYGFKRDDKWIVALNYIVRADGSLTNDDGAGRVPYGVDVTGAAWGSYLQKNVAWNNLTPDEQRRTELSMPVIRTPAPEPEYANGVWVTDRNYYSNGTGLGRQVFKPR